MWIPRVLLAPLYLVNEYLLRRPLAFALRRANALASTRDETTRGDPANVVLAPTFLYDRGVLPEAGLYYASDRWLVRGNQVRSHVATWGPRATDAVIRDRYFLDSDDALQARVAVSRHRDELYQGTRYGSDRAGLDLAYRRKLVADGWLELGGGVHRVAFLSGSCCDDPSLDQAIANGLLAPPSGYRDDYTTVTARAAFAIDTRGERPQPASGVKLAVHADLDHAQLGSWASYGGLVAGTVDLSGTERLLTLQLAVEIVDGDDAPFTAYPLATADVMPGFAPGDLIGPSFAAAQLAYEWPIGAWLDARLRFAIGNAFGRELAGLSPSNLRLAGDAGLVVAHFRDMSLEVLGGVGTRTIGRGEDITNVQITVGTRRQF